MRPVWIGGAAVALLACVLAARGEPDAAGPAPALEPWRTLAAHAERVRCLQFAPDGRLASGGADRSLRLWSAEGELLRSLDLRPDGG